MSISKLQAPLYFLAALCIVGLTACSQQTSSAASSDTSGQSPAASSSQNGFFGSGGSSNQSAIYGKVTAIDGSKITLALGTFNRNFQGRTGNGSQSTASGSDRGTPPNGQNGGSGNQGTPDGSKAGGSPNSRGTPRMGADITLSGQTTTNTISDTSVIKRMNRGERKSQQSSESASSRASVNPSASLSDIKVGTILSVAKSGGGKITSVLILSDPGTQSAK